MNINLNLYVPFGRNPLGTVCIAELISEPQSFDGQLALYRTHRVVDQNNTARMEVLA